ncbi:MAG: hypothetical protein OXJ54_01395 [Gemmatimonadetes bacterium]|nr:hypothetical protein [Candidatus Palauibacter rhopaloidicola]
MTDKRDDSPTRNEHFPRIDATPEQLAKAFLRDPPRNREEWDYMKGRKSREARSDG